MGGMFGLHLCRCGPHILGVRVWCDWRKILVLQLVVPKVKIVVKKGTSVSVVYCICIVYFVFLVHFFIACGPKSKDRGGVHMMPFSWFLLIRIMFFG